MEEWKDIVGYEGLYQVSNTGRVKSLKKCELLMKHQISNCGYCRVSLRKPKSSIKYSIHRLVAEAFLPNPNNLPQVNHIDGNKLNNLVDNLEWNTRSENQKHAYRNRLQISLKGEKHNMNKLTQLQVNEIREKYATKKYSQAELSCEYNVSKSHISDIINYRYWK
jgi:hypothetical protein